MSNPKISIVVPLYNESENFNALTSRLNKLIEEWGNTLEVVLVNDGSTDSTPLLVQTLSLENHAYQAVFLSRNFGHQIALSAGMMQANGTEGVFIIDGDLQDPPELLEQFYKKLKEGYDVVYGIRKDRKESFFFKLCYSLYYRIQKKMAYVDIKVDSGDFSLLSRRAVNIINSVPGKKFIRGLRSYIGFKQVGIEYERNARNAGKSKYSFLSLIKLGTDGIFNFSDAPILLLRRLGLATILLSLIYLIYNLIKHLVLDTIPTGYTSLLGTIILFGGVQLLSISIIGEYIIRIFSQVKARPLYVIDKTIINGKVIIHEK